MKSKLARIFTTAVVLAVALSVAAPGMLSAKRVPVSGKIKKRSDAELSVISRAFTTTNNVLFGVDNRGNIGKDPGGSSTTGGGYWRTRTDQYVFQSGLMVAGIFDADGDGAFGDTVETESVYDEEWREGKASTTQDDPANHLYISSNAAHLAAWPDEFRDENGEPKVFGQEDMVCIYTDVGGPVNPSAGRFRLGVEVYQRLKIFSVSSQKDILYARWRFKNATEYIDDDVNGDGVVDVSGPYEIRGVLTEINTDFDVGDADDDRAAVSPLLNMAIYWDTDFSEGNFSNPVGFFGIKFLDSPTEVGRPADGVDNDGDGQIDEEGEANRIGLSGFTITTNRGGGREDPNTDAEAYRIMTNAPGEVTEPVWDPEADLIVSDFEDDLRARLLTGPFTLPSDGKLQAVEAGYFFADPLRSPADPTDITLDGELLNLVGLAQTVQTTFDTDFNLPAPPVSPNLRIIERDGSVLLTWDDLPENTPDPFYPVSQVATNPDGTPAATYNPDYLEYDFQGYRVYRSLTPESDDAVLVAQYDLADGVTSGSATYTIQTGADVDGDSIPDFADVTFDPFDIGFSGDDDAKDTGLKYIWTDRGQGLGLTREGLINGVKYYYAVTAFDYQPSNIGQESLESGLQLIALDADGINTREATPRTDPAGFSQGGVGAVNQLWPDGTPITADDIPNLTLDENGDIVEDTPQPPSGEGFEVSVTLADGDPALLPKGGLYVVVDSITIPMAPGGLFGIPADAWYDINLHFEDGSGSVIGSHSIPVNGFGFYGAPGDPFLSAYAIEHPSMPGMVLAIEFTWNREHNNGIYVQDLQTSGSIAYDNITQPVQRSYLVNYGTAWSFDFSYPDEFMMLADYTSIGPSNGTILGAVRCADIELEWVSDGADLTLQVTDLSNKVPIRFNQLPNDGWGFVPKDKQPLDFQVDYQGADNLLQYWLELETAPGDLIAKEVTLADGSTQPFATDDGVTRNLYLVDKLSLAIKPSNYDMAGTELKDADGNVTGEGPDLVADLTGTEDLDLYLCGVMYQINGITSRPSAGDKWKARIRWDGQGGGQNPARGGGGFPGPAVYGNRVPVAGNKWKVDLVADTMDVEARDLSRIRVVPNPYIVSSSLDLSTTDKQIIFNHLPPAATIRIYTVAGHLVDVVDHDNGSGTAYWDIRSRFNQKIASGYYIYHVTDIETGQTHMGKFAVIQ